MPDTGAPWAIPYPASTDPPDDPVQSRTRAEKIAAQLTVVQNSVTAITPKITQIANTAFVAAADFTINAAYTRAVLFEFGPTAKFVQLFTGANRINSAIVAPATGNIANTPVIVLPNNVVPLNYVHGIFSWDSGSGGAYVTPAGKTVTLADMYPSQTLPIGALVVFDAFYTLN